MKSAYELAMERLEKESPSAPPLTDEQKKALAEIDRTYTAKIEEKKILTQQEQAQNYGNPEAMETIEERMRQDIRILESERDRKKDEIRQSTPK